MATITVWSDIGCPWASLFVWRATARRAALGLEDAVWLDHRCFPLELVNERPTPRAIVDAEVEALAPLVPDAGWRPWWRDASAYPVTTLPALEAVQAAKAQGFDAAERLDLALRQAFWRDSRCVSIWPEIVNAAESAGVDVDALEKSLGEGEGRRAVFADWRSLKDEGVQGSPHVFLPDGTDVANPGIEQHWEGPKPGGKPVVDSDDVTAIDDLLRRAAAS